MTAAECGYVNSDTTATLRRQFVSFTNACVGFACVYTKVPAVGSYVSLGYVFISTRLIRWKKFSSIGTGGKRRERRRRLTGTSLTAQTQLP